MSRIKGTQTEKNLLAAFAGESQARNRYTLSASKAREEGYEQIADLFLETAENERLHAKRFFSFLEGGMVEITAVYPAGKIGSTQENLQASADGENEEHTQIYPQMAEIAEKEGFRDIAAAFRGVAKVEVEHERRYRKLLENVKNNQVFKKDTPGRWKCKKCGYIHEGIEPPKKCPVCLHTQAYFELASENY